MDRRSFIAVTASGATLAVAVEAQAFSPRRLPRVESQEVVLSGWLVQPNPAHPHIFALVADPSHARPMGSPDAERRRLAVWIHPQNAGTLRAGQQVRMAGRLHLGKFADEHSGYAAQAALTEAREV